MGAQHAHRKHLLRIDKGRQVTTGRHAIDSDGDIRSKLPSANVIDQSS